VGALLGLAITLPGFSESATPPKWNGTFDAVSIDDTQTNNEWRLTLSLLEQNFPKWLRGFIEFFSPISPERKSVTKEQSQKEGQKTEEVWVHWVLFPMLAFLVRF
jgi:hypothetical protein